MANLISTTDYSGSIASTEIEKALSGAYASISDAVLEVAYNKQFKIRKSHCRPTDPVAVRCLYLYAYALSNYASLVTTVKRKQFVFEVPMLIYLEDAGHLYKDSSCASDTTFHTDMAGSDNHYIHGIYGGDNGEYAYWKNTGKADLFRITYYKDDVGVANHSNRGINEIGGFVATSANAFEAWKTNLVNHTVYQLAAKGLTVLSCSVSLKNSVTTLTSTTNTVYLTIELGPEEPTLTSLVLNSLATNEWNKIKGQALAGWAYSQVTLLDAFHKRNSASTQVYETYMNGSWLTEQALMGVLTKVEQISKSCCNE